MEEKITKIAKVTPTIPLLLGEEMRDKTNQAIHLVVTDPEWFFNYQKSTCLINLV